MSSRWSCALTLLLGAAVVLGILVYTPPLPNPTILACKAYVKEEKLGGRVYFEVDIENTESKGEVVVGVRCFPLDHHSSKTSGDYELVGPVGHWVSRGRSKVVLSSEFFALQPFAPTDQTMRAGKTIQSTNHLWQFKAYVLNASSQTHH